MIWGLLRFYGTELVENAYNNRSFDFLNRLIKNDIPLPRYLHYINQLLNEILIIGIALSSVPFLNHMINAPSLFQRLGNSLNANIKSSVLIFAVIMFSVCLFFTYIVLLDFPNSADEYAYLLQAQTMSEGKLWNDPHPKQEFFDFINVIHKDGKWVGRFPPGWPLILTLGSVLNIPTGLINPIIGSITILVLFYYARSLHGNLVAFWAILSFSLSSFYIFNSSSYFSHALCALEILLAVTFMHKSLSGGRVHYTYLAGLFVGLAAITRYYTAFLFLIAVVIFLLISKPRKTLLPTLFALLVGIIPPIIFLLWYNYSITGNPFVLVTSWAGEESLGFIKGHNLVTALSHLVRRLVLFVTFSSPMLLFLYLYYLVKLAYNRNRWQLGDLFFALLMIGHIFYHEIGGNQYGPRFYYEGYPLLIVFVVQNILRDIKNVQPHYKVISLLFFLGLAISVVKIPLNAQTEQSVIKERMDLYDQVSKNNLNNAIVVVRNGTGVSRPMPIGDLLRNGAHFDDKVIYVRDLGSRNKELFNQFPDRNFYYYTRSETEVNGRITKISIDNKLQPN